MLKTVMLMGMRMVTVVALSLDIGFVDLDMELDYLEFVVVVFVAAQKMML